MTHVAVIGGGIGGAAAALRLAQAGADVTLLEAGDSLGGLVVSFSVGGTPLECFYHHVFPQETHIRGVIQELGLELDWRKSSMGIYRDGRVWPFTGATDLLRFKPLSLVNRVRAGVGALRLGRAKDWESLDGVRAIDWLSHMCGQEVADVVWDPLLRQKFGSAANDVPAAWMWGRLQQRSGARRTGEGERLGYMRGGFARLFDALGGRLTELGVDVRLRSPVQSVVVTDGRAAGVQTANGEQVDADAVLFAGTLPRLVPLLPADLVDPRWTAIGGLGAMCVIVQLDRPLQDAYWVNVCDDSLPFGGVIEHTNFIPASDYAGRHVVYLSRYFTQDEPVATVDADEEAGRWVGLLEERFSRPGGPSVIGVDAFRTPYAAPLVRLGYRSLVPPIRSHVPGLYLATTAQIYPDDRGMSEGVRLATDAVKLIVEDASVRPVHDR